jgi:hypothetical protein
VSTIWRILKRRGFVTPQPHKRPKSSYIRFEAQLPNEMWQQSMTAIANSLESALHSPALRAGFRSYGWPDRRRDRLPSSLSI